MERHLAGCPEAVLLAMTLGPGVDAQIKRAGIGDVAAQAATDALASTLAEQVCDQAEEKLRALAREENLYLTGRYSPGYGDWPITVQPRIAAPAGYPQAHRPVCHRYLPDAPPQERHCSDGSQRCAGHRQAGRLCPLCPAGKM